MSGKYDLESRRQKYSTANGTFRRLDQLNYETSQLDNRGYVANGQDTNRNELTNYNERAIDVQFLTATSPTSQGVESSHQKVVKKKHKNGPGDTTTENASTPTHVENLAPTQVAGSKTTSEMKTKSEEKKHGGFFKRLTHSWRKHDSEPHHRQKVKRKHTDDTISSSSSSSSSGHGEAGKTNGEEMFEIKLPHSSSKTSFDSKHSEHLEPITKMDLSEFSCASGADPNPPSQVTEVVLKDNINAAPDYFSAGGIAPDGFNTNDQTPDYFGSNETAQDYSNTNETTQDYFNTFVTAPNYFNSDETASKYLSTNETASDYFSADDNTPDFFNVNDTFLDYFNTKEPASDYANYSTADYDDVAETVQEDYETIGETNGRENFSTDPVNGVYEDVVVVAANISHGVEENIPDDSDTAVEVIPCEVPDVTFKTQNVLYDVNHCPIESLEAQKEEYFVQSAPQDVQALHWITFNNVDSEQQVHEDTTTGHSFDSEKEQQAHQEATADHSSDSEKEQQAHKEATADHSSDSEKEQQAHQEATADHSSDSSEPEDADEDTRCGSQSDDSDIVVDVMQSYYNQSIDNCPSESAVLPTDHQVLHHSEKKILIVNNQTIHHSEKYFFIPAKQSYHGEDIIYILDDISVQHTEDYFNIANNQELIRIEDQICLPDSQQEDNVSPLMNQSDLNYSSSASSFTSSSDSSSPKSTKKITDVTDLETLQGKIGIDILRRPKMIETEMYVVTLLSEDSLAPCDTALQNSTETPSPTKDSLVPFDSGLEDYIKLSPTKDSLVPFDSGLEDSIKLRPTKFKIDQDSQLNSNGKSPEDHNTPVQMSCVGQDDGEGLMDQLALIMEREFSEGVGHKVTSEKPEDTVPEINCKTEPLCHVIQDRESGEVVECPDPAPAHECTASVACESGVSVEHTGLEQAVSLTHVHQDGESAVTLEIPTHGSESLYIHVKQDGKLIQLLNPRHFLSKIKKNPGKSSSGGKSRKGSRNLQREIKHHKVTEDYFTVACVREPEPERKNIDIFTVVYQPCSAEIVYAPKLTETSDMSAKLTEQNTMHPLSTGTEQNTMPPLSTGTEQNTMHPLSTGTEQNTMHPLSTGTEQNTMHQLSTGDIVENDIEANFICQSNVFENASLSSAVTVSKDATDQPVGELNECPTSSHKLTVKEILDLDLPESSVNQHSRRGSSLSSSDESSSGAKEKPIGNEFVCSLNATNQVFDTHADEKIKSVEPELPMKCDFVDYENNNNINDSCVSKIEDVSVNAGSLDDTSWSAPVVEQHDDVSVPVDETNQSLTILSNDSKETFTLISNISSASATEQDISDTQLQPTSDRSGSLSSMSSSSSEEEDRNTFTKPKDAEEEEIPKEEEKKTAEINSSVAVVDQDLHSDDVTLLHHQLMETEIHGSKINPDQKLCHGVGPQPHVTEKEKHAKKTKKIESQENDQTKKKHTFFSWPFKKNKKKTEEVKSDEASSGDEGETEIDHSVPPSEQLDNEQLDNGYDTFVQEETGFNVEIPNAPKTSTPQKMKEHTEERLGENLTDITSPTEYNETWTSEKLFRSKSVSSSSSEGQAYQSFGLTLHTQPTACVIIDQHADGFKNKSKKHNSDTASSDSSTDSSENKTAGQYILKTFAKQKHRHKSPKTTSKPPKKANNGETLTRPKSQSDKTESGESFSSSSEEETSRHHTTPSHISDDKHGDHLILDQPKKIQKCETVDAQKQSEIKLSAPLVITDKAEATSPKSQKGNKISKFLPMLRSPTKKEADINFDNVQDFSQRFDGQFHREDDVTQGLADDQCKSSSALSVSKTEEVPSDFQTIISEHRHFVVVAIDVGTTHSGYAFSFVREPGSVYMMRRWSGEEPGLVNQKTLTSLLLTPEGKFHSFGYNARSSYLNLVPMEAKHWMYFSTFKMELHHNTELSLDTNLVAMNGAKFPAIKVFAHCLEFFKTHALQQLSDQCGTEILNEDIRWVITVPAIWKAPAKQFMRQAAYEAGLASPDFPEQLLIALEPEAASIYCRTLRMHELVPEHPLKRQLQSPGRLNTELNSSDMAVTELTVGSRYLIVDCGGGTVDITVHELDTTGHIKELHQATGGPHGSIGVDAEFEKLLCGIFGADFIEHYKKKYPMGWVHLMTDFESRKRSTSPVKTTFLNVSPPFTFISDFKKHKTDPELAVKRYGDPEVDWSPQGMLRLSPLAMRQLFLPTLSHIKQAIGDVLNHPNARDVKYMFLVGGFSESPLLHHEMRQEFSGIMKLLIPQEVSLAILKGAVLFGLDPSIVNVRRSRLTYGVGILNKYDSSQHPQSKLIKRSGLEWCTDIFDKYVETDQPVLLGTSVVRRYAPANKGQTSIVLNIYSSQNSQVKFITDPGVTRCGTLSLTLPSLEDADTAQHPRAIETQMSFGDTEINVVAKDVSSGKMVKATVDFLGT